MLSQISLYIKKNKINSKLKKNNWFVFIIFIFGAIIILFNDFEQSISLVSSNNNIPAGLIKEGMHIKQPVLIKTNIINNNICLNILSATYGKKDNKGNLIITLKQDKNIYEKIFPIERMQDNKYITICYKDVNLTIGKAFILIKSLVKNNNKFTFWLAEKNENKIIINKKEINRSLVFFITYKESLSIKFFYIFILFCSLSVSSFLSVKRSIIFLFLFIIGLILLMSVISNDNPSKHPDESLHIAAANYYINPQNWIFPSVGSYEPIYKSNGYGTSYLDAYNIGYLFAGKFVSILNIITDSDQNIGIKLRLFNVFLFFIVSILFLYRKETRLFTCVLLLTPQIWYLFSYINNGAFPLFFSLLVVYQIIYYKSIYNEFLEKNNIWGGIYMGVLFGLILLSKINYYSFLFFMGSFFLWQLFFSKKKTRKVLLKKFMLIGVISISIFTAFFIYDLSINGLNKKEKRIEQKEIYAMEQLKPHNNKSLKDSNETYLNLFKKYNWHKKTFESLVGVYGGMNIKATPSYYIAMFFLWGSFLLYLIFGVYLKAGKKEKFLVFIILLSSLFIIFMSIYHSWTVDFQPQGKYLLPIIPMLMIYLYYTKKYMNDFILNIFITLLILMSLYSFIFIGLFKIL